jgi:hypothetical protein
LDAVTRLQSWRSHRESSSHSDLQKNGDSRRIEKGQTLVLGDLEGPGVITHFWCTVASPDPFYPRSLVLRIYWDGAEKPSVESPLGDFFGVGHGAMATYASLPVSVTSHGRARTCYWRMPFRKRARVTVANESDTYDCDSFYYYLDWEKHESLPADIAYFHAQYRQDTPAKPGDYTILETAGRGQYVGTVYSVHQVENGWFGEGDDRFYIDGEEMPSLRGTGTEDYFCDAWGFRAFGTSYYGVSLFEGYFAGDRVTAYRWHLPDPITFRQSLKVTIEHKGSVFTDNVNELGGFIERPDWISSVAFWYQSPPVALNRPLPPIKERIAPYRVLSPSDLGVRADPAFILVKEKGTVLYAPAKPDASIEFDFQVPENGRYILQAIMTHSLLGGLYQALLDGKAIGAPLDLCIEGMDELWVRLDQHNLAEGKHTLRFEGRGSSLYVRSMAKPIYSLGLVHLVFLRVDDMKGYHDAMDADMKVRGELKRESKKYD